jgi:pimeloyl-ACP methyl ester carboxylesterase
MGGYIVLAFAEAFPEYLAGYSLFHSTPFSDTPEKKINREREIDLIRQGKKELIINAHMDKAFANSNVLKLSKEIKYTRKLARNTPDYGIIPLLRGMIERPDRTSLLINSDIPFLWILGRKDNYINYEQLRARINTGPKGEVCLLEESGHMGFIEEQEKSLAKITDFVNASIG